MPLYGVDVGSYQAGIDMDEVRAEGFEFVLAKIGQGAGRGDKGASYGQSLNPAWKAQRDGARKAGMLLAGYWYVGGTESPASQAARCKAAIGDPTLPLALDWEDASGTWSTFLAVLAAFRAAGLRVVLAYTPKWYGDSHGMGPNALVGTGLALWSSRYPSTTPGSASALYRAVPASYWAGYSGAPVTILQFADSAHVAGHTVDANAYQGTRAELSALLTGTPTTPSEDDMAFQSGTWPAGTGARQTLSCPVGPKFMYGSGWFSLGVGWADATVQVMFVGARNTDGTRTYTGGTGGPVTLPYDVRVPYKIPAGTELISIAYTSASPLGWSLELVAG